MHNETVKGDALPPVDLVAQNLVDQLMLLDLVEAFELLVDDLNGIEGSTAA